MRVPLSALLVCGFLGLSVLSACTENRDASLPAIATASANGSVRGNPAVLTGVVIPLYANPGKWWDEAIAAKRAHPSVPILVIANIDNGPGPGTKYGSYANYISKAQSAGITVIGYVYTSYGNRERAAVESQMLQWRNLYAVTGIFLDEMSQGDRPFYTALTAYAHAHSLPLVMGNPGDNAPGNDGPDVINFWESKGYPPLSYLEQPAHTKYGKGRWSYMAGAVPLDPATITASVPYVAYIYATDGKEPECYCELPTYFTQLVALLDARRAAVAR